ncbi:hypothetical protein [Oricola sp.]|uniref:hypothetical protein n=1 Tax=Oricola sp. TaxID=1979950 RepID=UPI00351685D3
MFVTGCRRHLFQARRDFRMRIFHALSAAIAILAAATFSSNATAEQADGNVCIDAGLVVLKEKFSSDAAIAKELGKRVDRFGRPVDRFGGPAVADANRGFRYNKYIVYSRLPDRGFYKYDPPRALNTPELRAIREEHGRALDEMIEVSLRKYAARFLKHLEPGTPEYAEAEKREIEKWRASGPGRYFLRRPVFFAPLFVDPFHQCDTGRYTAMDGEFALFAGESSPRVKGELCTDSPTLVFDVGRSSLLKEVRYFAQSEIMRGGTMSFRRYNDYRGRNLLLETRLLEILSLMARQCRQAPKQVEVVLQRQDTSIETLRTGQLGFETLYRGLVYQNDDGTFAMETTELTSAGEKLFDKEAAKQRVRDARRRRAEARDEQFALGAALVVGILAGLEIYSPCHDRDENGNLRSGAVLLGCQTPD